MLEMEFYFPDIIVQSGQFGFLLHKYRLAQLKNRWPVSRNTGSPHNPCGFDEIGTALHCLDPDLILQIYQSGQTVTGFGAWDTRINESSHSFQKD